MNSYAPPLEERCRLHDSVLHSARWYSRFVETFCPACGEDTIQVIA